MKKCDLKNMLYKKNLKSRPLSVLLYLIDRANQDFMCFPSIKTISKDLNVSVSTTKRALNYLVEIGYIEKIERFLDPTGRQSSNLYKINIDNIENNNIKLFNSKPNTTDKNPKEEKTKSKKIILLNKENCILNNTNLFILELLNFLSKFNYTNFKHNVLKNIKEYSDIIELLTNKKMNWGGVHFYTPFN